MKIFCQRLALKCHTYSFLPLFILTYMIGSFVVSSSDFTCNMFNPNQSMEKIYKQNLRDNFDYCKNYLQAKLKILIQIIAILIHRLNLQEDTTEDSARRKAECLVQLTQMPTPEDLLQGTTGNSESVTSDTESSASVSISQGITAVIFLKVLLLLYFSRDYFYCISHGITSVPVEMIFN